LATRTGNGDKRIQSDQSWGQVGGIHSVAWIAAEDGVMLILTVFGMAFLSAFDYAVEWASEVPAAIVLADITANRALVANLRCSSGFCGFRNYVESATNDLALSKFRKRNQRSDSGALFLVELNPSQFPDRLNVHKSCGTDDSFLHFGQKVGSARDDLGVSPQQLRNLPSRAHVYMLELSQANRLLVCPV
jgi:hypothetical protein